MQLRYSGMRSIQKVRVAPLHKTLLLSLPPVVLCCSICESFPDCFSAHFVSIDLADMHAVFPCLDRISPLTPAFLQSNGRSIK